jgi:hypothetical protein
VSLEEGGDRVWSAEVSPPLSYSVASVLERANTKAEAIASALHIASRVIRRVEREIQAAVAYYSGSGPDEE